MPKAFYRVSLTLPMRQFMSFGIPQAPDTLYALNATCPHQQCEVDWKGDQAEFVCPCHQGKFAPDGTVLAAPPTSDLVAYRASIEGDQVLVRPS
jgi:cytochrome b6-f complex iron-sulfur subunit